MALFELEYFFLDLLKQTSHNGGDAMKMVFTIDNVS